MTGYEPSRTKLARGRAMDTWLKGLPSLPKSFGLCGGLTYGTSGYSLRVRMDKTNCALVFGRSRGLSSDKPRSQPSGREEPRILWRRITRTLCAPKRRTVLAAVCLLDGRVEGGGRVKRNEVWSTGWPVSMMYIYARRLGLGTIVLN